LAGAAPVSVEPSITVTARDHHELARAMPLPQRPFAVLHPGATDVRRRWPVERMAALADALDARSLQVFVTGVAAEQDIVTTVTAAARANVESLCARLSLRALTALLSMAELVVSNDTGPLHLARALGTPTTGIYWFGNVVNAGPVTTARHRCCLGWRTHCPRCGMDCIRNDAHIPRDGCDH